MKILKVKTLAFLFCFPIFNVNANWSGNITLASNYLINGISQTQDKMAAQAGVTWSADNGFYLGSWATNVDYNPQANVEIDGYIGYYHPLSESTSVDVGISKYTYYGSNTSSELNFTESYLKWQLGKSQIDFYYSWDYLATDARHLVIMASHNIEISERFSIVMSIDKSRSLDKNKWLWQPQDKDYLHGEISGHYQFHQFDFSIALHSTDLDQTGDTLFLFSVSRSFGE